MFSKVVGGILGMVAFAVACIVGLLAGNDVTTVLTRGLIAMAVFFVVGLLAGAVGRRLVDEHMQRVVDADRDAQLARMHAAGEPAPAAPTPEAAGRNGSVQPARPPAV
jgi:hypothetical protein